MDKQKIEINSNLLNQINASFREPKNETVKTRPCRIKFCNRFITTSSGKTVWRNIAHAKSALINHFRMDYNICRSIQEEILGINDKYSYRGSSVVKDVIKKLEKDGYIQYIEVDVEEYASQKRR